LAHPPESLKIRRVMHTDRIFGYFLRKNQYNRKKPGSVCG